MFLIGINRRLRRLRDDDRGVALVAVMALMALGMLLSTMILTSVITGLGSTTSTRAGVQSQVSADGGLDVVLASLVSGTTCTPTYTSSVAPKYTVTVSYTTDTTLSSTTSWISGCPTSSAIYMKLTSVGTATAPGATGNTTGNAKTVEGIYKRPVQTVTTTATGPAVYAYSSQDYGGSGTLVSADGTNDANVMVQTGDVNCSGSSPTSGDLVVKNGNLTISGSCNIKGNVWLSGNSSQGILTMSGGNTIGGNAVVQGATVTNGPSIGGGVWSTGAVTTGSASIGGGITVTNGAYTSNGSTTIAGGVWSSGNVSMTNGDFVGASAVEQNFAMNGTLNIKGQLFAKYAVTGVNWNKIDGSVVAQSVQSGLQAGGGVTTYPSGTPAQPAASAAPIAPSIPGWVEFTYNAADWSGFTIYTVPSGTTCDEPYIQAAVASFGSHKGLIDARNCTGQVSINGGNVTIPLQNDVAIISSTGFNMANSYIGSSAAHNLWLIQPDSNSADGVPTTTGCTPTVFTNGFNFTGSVTVMTYTPCEVQMGSSMTYTGQIFSGAVKVDGAAHLTYTPVGLPGWNLNTGTRTTTGTASTNWTLQSTRNIGG